jgi:uncharacterized protein (TIGR03435 family)
MDSSVADELRKLNKDQRRLEWQQMFQALLADRFKLTLHRDQRNFRYMHWSLRRTAPNCRRQGLEILTPKESKVLMAKAVRAGFLCKAAQEEGPS